MEITGLPTPVFCGVDWAEDHHDIALVDVGGRQLAKKRISDDAEGLPSSSLCWTSTATAWTL